MSNKGYDMYFDVPIYSKNCIRDSDARNSCGSDYFTWINIISIFLVYAFISPGLFRMLTIFVIYFTYVVQVVMTLDHIGH